jgi:preprotein translocase subunit SecA
MIRDDRADLIYLTTLEKYEAIAEDIEECRKQKRPVLVGTVSIENSELLSNLLKKKKIPHAVLNAKFHEKEADIIAQAGRPGTVTIATNMAGRGTDIVLGGSWMAEVEKLDEPTNEKIEKIKQDWQKLHDAVIEAGGLHIIGTERHESRRIDNQLRGRAGRQGDPGSSRFYLSLEDSLMRIFASERMATMMKRLGMKEGEAIEHPWVTRAIENAQRKVEGRNFDVRKQLLEYDDVANDQRSVVYEQRNELLDEGDISETIVAIREDVINSVISEYVPPQSLAELWDLKGLEERLRGDFHIDVPLQKWLEEEEHFHEEVLRERVLEKLIESYQEKEEMVGPEVLRRFEKSIMLQSLDQHWKEHLAAMDHLRQGIHLRGYAQKNPQQEYKKEAFALFTDMLEALKLDVVTVLSKVKVRAPEDVDAVDEQRKAADSAPREFRHEQSGPAAEEPTQQNDADAQGQPVRKGAKVGRNEPCPCGSGKKYKHCHGKL